jgi:hypothetical protein
MEKKPPIRKTTGMSGSQTMALRAALSSLGVVRATLRKAMDTSNKTFRRDNPESMMKKSMRRPPYSLAQSCVLV